MNISIITPSLNSEKYILNNLKSVHLEQKGDFSIEQIIVDGGSTDRTIKIIESFKEENKANISLVQEEDKNMYDAINKGLKHIKGDIWACLNTDDQYKPGIFSLVVETFNKNPEIEVVYGYLDIIDESRNFLATSYLPEFDLKLLILTKYASCIKQPATFLTKSVIDTVGYFDIKYQYASDYDYLIRVSVDCKMKLIRKSLTNFRRTTDSLSGSEKTKMILRTEAKEISNNYKNKFGISNRGTLLCYLKIFLIHIKPKNFKYLLKKPFL